MSRISVSDAFEKLEKRPASEALESLLDLCEARFSERKPVTANFLYFANAEMRHLFEPGVRTDLDESYWRILMDADVLFPDGIALSLSYCRYARPETSPLSMLTSYREMGDATLPNLNGTDLLPELLQRFRERFGDRSRGYFYGTKEGAVRKAAENLSAKVGMPIGFRDGFRDFDHADFQSRGDFPTVLFVGLGTPKQELWSARNAAELWPTLVVTVGGFLDFMGGGEVRAPEFMRKLRFEWLWRVLSNPKKNGKKVLTSLKFFPRFFWGFGNR